MVLRETSRGATHCLDSKIASGEFRKETADTLIPVGGMQWRVGLITWHMISDDQSTVAGAGPDVPEAENARSGDRRQGVGMRAHAHERQRCIVPAPHPHS